MPAKMAAHPHSSTPTFYIPVVSPPTPAPSPRLSAFDPPSTSIAAHLAPSPSNPSLSTQPHSISSFTALSPALRFQHLAALLAECTPEELLFISTTITPLLRRDFLRDLPAELAFHVLSFVDDPRTLARASRVSRTWNRLLEDQWLWRRMCDVHGYSVPEQDSTRDCRADDCGMEDDLDAISNISGEPSVLAASLSKTMFLLRPFMQAHSYVQRSCWLALAGPLSHLAASPSRPGAAIIRLLFSHFNVRVRHILAAGWVYVLRARRANFLTVFISRRYAPYAGQVDAWCTVDFPL